MAAMLSVSDVGEIEAAVVSLHPECHPYRRRVRGEIEAHIAQWGASPSRYEREAILGVARDSVTLAGFAETASPTARLAISCRAIARRVRAADAASTTAEYRRGFGGKQYYYIVPWVHKKIYWRVPGEFAKISDDRAGLRALLRIKASLGR